MKVLHLITRLDPGGSAENTLLTCQHLMQRGWEVTLAAGPGLRRERATVGGVDVPQVTVRWLRRDPCPHADVLAFFEIVGLLRRERPTILHTHSAKAGILGRWAALVARVPHVVHTPHGHVLYGYARGVKNRLYLLAERLTAPLTDRLVALSEGELRESTEAGIGKPGRWVVIPSGIEISRFEPRPAGPPRPGAADFPDSAPGAGEQDPTSGIKLRVGSVARLTHVKGLDLAIRAVALLARGGGASPVNAASPVTAASPANVAAPVNAAAPLLRIWGDGELRGELVDLATREGIAELVSFEGTERPVGDLLAGLDVYLQPSRNEGMGRALVMAQAVGLPVVATRVCGIPDVVLDGETGVLAAPEDPADLARALRSVLQDPGLRRRLGRRARAWVREPDASGHPRFSVEAMNWHIERLYRNLAGDDAPGRRASSRESRRTDRRPRGSAAGNPQHDKRPEDLR